MYRDNNKDLTHKEKEQTVKDKDNGKNWAHKDRKNDLKLVLKESRRTRTWINITITGLFLPHLLTTLTSITHSLFHSRLKTHLFHNLSTIVC